MGGLVEAAHFFADYSLPPEHICMYATPSVMPFKLAIGDRFMLVSNGIPEACDAAGHLFGFERLRDLLLSNSSAAQLAGAAQRCGQQDDISVISVTRTAIPAGIGNRHNSAPSRRASMMSVWL